MKVYSQSYGYIFALGLGWQELLLLSSIHTKAIRIGPISFQILSHSKSL